MVGRSQGECLAQAPIDFGEVTRRKRPDGDKYPLWIERSDHWLERGRAL
jgi:hypothetical protein